MLKMLALLLLAGTVYDDPPGGAAGGGSGDITDVYNCASGNCQSIALTDGDFLNMSAVNCSGTSEGLRVPQAASCAAATAEGQVCWDTDDDVLYLGDGAAVVGVTAFSGDMAGTLLTDSTQALCLGAACDAAGSTGSVTVGGANFVVDNTSQFDGSLNVTSGIVLWNNVPVSATSATMGGYYGRNTNQTVDAPYLTTGTTANHIVITENADYSTDMGHTQQTNPTIYLHSADATATGDWISLAHNQVDAVIDAGNGNIKFGTTTTHIVTTETPTGTTETIDWSTGNVQILDLTSTSGNVTAVNFTDPTAVAATGVSLFLLIKQHATVPRTVGGWDTDVEWAAGGTAPTITATNSAIDAVSCIFVTSDTEYYCSVAQDYQ